MNVNVESSLLKRFLAADSFILFDSMKINSAIDKLLPIFFCRTRSSNTELAAESQEANNKISEQTELCPFDNFLADFEEVYMLILFIQ